VTQLVVVDAADFNEGGGQLQIISDAATELVTYSSVDDDADTIKLSAPTTAAHVATDFVRVYPDSRERRAQVRLDVDGESIDARVPHALFDRIAEGRTRLRRTRGRVAEARRRRVGDR
jgi:hypothetical protein